MGCAQQSQERNEELIGTTLENISRWVLLPYGKEWPARIKLDALVLPSKTKDMIAQALAVPQTRLQLIKRTHLTMPESLFFFEDGQLYQQNENTTSLTKEDMDPYDGSMILICTHGSRDRCCGTLGGKLYAQAAKRYPSMTWQASHLGGHRFAPTLLSLPQAMMYGRVQESDIDLLCTHTTSNLPFSLSTLRGIPAWPAKVQVAAAEYWKEHRTSISSWNEEDGRVRLNTEKGDFSYHVEKKDTGILMHPSCMDPKTKPMYRYVCSLLS